MMEKQEVKPSEIKTPLVDLITKHGYPAEVYDDITTEDGYILTSYRIPHGRTNNSDSPKPVVMLMHGLVSNSGDFLVQGPQGGLAFVLSDNGYDVWLPHGRGRSGSRKHLKVDCDNDPEYWKFSYHEVSVYDLPALINQIQKTTGLRTIAYIGFSQGSLFPAILLSERPEFNERFNLIISLSSTVFVQHIKSIPFRLLFRTRRLWLPVMKITRAFQFPSQFILNCMLSLSSYVTETNSWLCNVAAQSSYFLYGRTPEQFMKAYIPLMLKYSLDSTSGLDIAHISQMYCAGVLQKFDHGRKLNIQRYGLPRPPPYDIKKVVAPIVIFCSSGDSVVAPKCANIQGTMLPNCIAIHHMEDPKFNHADFLYGKHAPNIIFPIAIEYLRKYCRVK